MKITLELMMNTSTSPLDSIGMRCSNYTQRDERLVFISPCVIITDGQEDSAWAMGQCMDKKTRGEM